MPLGDRVKSVGLTLPRGLGSAAAAAPALEPPAKVELWKEPTDAIELFGYMLQDANLIQDRMKRLPFAGSEYRSELRVILSATMRQQARLKRLLGEDDPA